MPISDGYCIDQVMLIPDMRTHSFTAIVYKEDDVYIAECPEVGTVDQGETIELAIAGLKEATRLSLEEFPLMSSLRTCEA